ncbi:MAG: ECF transporter S component [Litorilinea sp.]
MTRTSTLATWMSGAIFLLATLMGLVAFLYPFWVPALAQSGNTGLAHSQDAPYVLALLTGICFVVLLLEVQGAGMSAKTVALLGVLISINSLLRFVDLAVPGPGGFSPIFLLIILVGYIYGPRLGFLMGALTLLVSSIITGAMGPWLPYQMFTAGWIGMSAVICRPLVGGLGMRGRLGEVVVLALFAGLWGLLYGVIMNIWFWPFVVGTPDQYWEPGIGGMQTVQRYAVFYAVTSLGWDLVRMAGNVVLLLVFGGPVLRVLQRFQRRFTFVYSPVSQPVSQTVSQANDA